MAKHCFVDESGTVAHQEIMTVALVMLEGGRTAEKLHPKLTKLAFRKPKLRGLKELERWYETRELHFINLSDAEKLAIGQELAKANIKAFVGYCRHTDESSEHEHRHLMYTELLKKTIHKAYEVEEDLVISIGKQGGSDIYGPPLLRALREIPQVLSAGGTYRRGNFFLASPSKQGQQISDFYASASWHYLQSGGDANRSGAFDLIKHQLCLEEISLETKELVKEK